MVLKTLDAMGSPHGYCIARRIEEISDDELQLNESTVYASLLRLRQQGWISALGAEQGGNERRTRVRVDGVLRRSERAAGHLAHRARRLDDLDPLAGLQRDRRGAEDGPHGVLRLDPGDLSNGYLPGAAAAGFVAGHEL